MHSSELILPSELMVRDERAYLRAVHRSKLSFKQKARFLASAREVRRRRESVPKFEYVNSLPISSRMNEIENLIAKHQVVIVAGETGTGKTTQIPLACLRAGCGLRGMIGHTQPSRLQILIIRVYNGGLKGVLGSGGFDAEAIIHGGVSSG